MEQKDNPSKKATVVLVGGGQVNSSVLVYFKKLSRSLRSKVDLYLVSEFEEWLYPSMIPGVVSGIYSIQEASVDLKALAYYSDCSFLLQSPTMLNPLTQTLTLQSKEVIPYDFLVVSLESSCFKEDSCVNFSACKSFCHQIQAAEERLVETKEDPNIVVVGRNLAAVELCFNLHSRFSKSFEEVSMQLVSDQEPLEEFPESFKRKVLQELDLKGIKVTKGTGISCIRHNALFLEDSQTIKGNLVVNSSLQLHPEFLNALPRTSEGLFLLDEYLQCYGFQNIMIVGQTCTQGSNKTNYYRQAQVVFKNLSKKLKSFFEATQEKLTKYEETSDELTILNLGDGRALATKWGKSLRGKTVMWTKDFLDKRFVYSFQAKKLFSKKELEDYRSVYS